VEADDHNGLMVAVPAHLRDNTISAFVPVRRALESLAGRR